MSEDNNAVVKRERVSLARDMATRYGLETGDFIKAIKEQVFPIREKAGFPPTPTDAEMIVFLEVCNKYGMDPFTQEIYPYESRSGVFKPIIGVDGWLRKINEHAQFNGMSLDEVMGKDGKPVSVTITIFRKDRDHPTVVTEYYDECYRPSGRDGKPGNGPWDKMPRRMLRHKAVRQGARYGFGFAATPDEDTLNEIHVGSGVSDSIAEATENKTKDLKAKIDAKKKADIKASQVVTPPADIPPQPESPVQAEVPQPPPVQVSEVISGPAPAPTQPTLAEVESEDPEALISKERRDSLVRLMLSKAPKQQAQDAMKAYLSRYGYNRTAEIRNSDYEAIYQWAENFGGADEAEI